MKKTSRAVRTHAFLALAAVLAGQATAAAANGAMTTANAKHRVHNIIVHPVDKGLATLAYLKQGDTFAPRDAAMRPRFVRTLATGALLFSVPDGGIDAIEANGLMVRMAADAAVAHVQPDMPVSAHSDDPHWSELWGLHEARAGSNLPLAWSLTRGKGVVVAVVDSGITRHDDLEGQILPGADFISSPRMARDGDGRDDDPTDEGTWAEPGECVDYEGPSKWHGTHVTGTIVAKADNGIGIAGVAPEARVLPVRALGRCGGTVVDMGEAIVWAAGGGVPGIPDNPHPAHVINVSMGGPWPCDPFSSESVAMARQLGAVVVVSAGNDSDDAAYQSPASCPGVIAVAASTRGGALAPYSNFGEVIHLSAPGGAGSFFRDDDILSTFNLGTTRPAAAGYAHRFGTSMAAPHVSGAAALVLAINPDLSPADVRDLLIDTARPMPEPCSKGCGSGLLDVGAAVEAARRSTIVPEPSGT